MARSAGADFGAAVHEHLKTSRPILLCEKVRPANGVLRMSCERPAGILPASGECYLDLGMAQVVA